jgi:hypothetical protein
MTIHYCCLSVGWLVVVVAGFRKWGNVDVTGPVDIKAVLRERLGTGTPPPPRIHTPELSFVYACVPQRQARAVS